MVGISSQGEDPMFYLFDRHEAGCTAEKPCKNCTISVYLAHHLSSQHLGNLAKLGRGEIPLTSFPLDLSLAQLGYWNKHVLKPLHADGIETLHQLLALTEGEVSGIPGVGRKIRVEIKEGLNKAGWRLAVPKGSL